MNFSLRVLPAVLAAFLTMTAHAAQADRLDDAEAALKAGRASDAGELLRNYTPETPLARARALWVLALVNIAENQPDRAIPLLERLVILLPNDPSVRLELGRAYVMAGRDTSARKQFDAAKAGQLTEAQRSTTDQYLQVIAARKTSESYLTFALVPETNAVKRTAAETVDIGQYTFTLDPNARQQAGVGVQLGFGHTILPRYSDTLRGRFGLHFDGKLYRQSDISEVIVTAEAGFENTLSQRALVRGGALAQVRFLGGERYSHGVGGYLGYTTLVGQAGRLDARAEVMRLTYPGFSGADGLRTTLTLGYRHALSPSLVVKGHALWSQTRANVASESSNNAALQFGVEKAFDGGLVLSGDVTRGSMKRKGRSQLFIDPRHDNTTTLSLRAYHSKFQIKGFSPTVEVSYERQKSNIVLNDYSNTRVSLGLSKRF